ncbi:hypothetical protein CASFOL_025688 [Castilleja foliolosa]|uniref:Uncharacterized protein n=1 Tax=Castilleja foliolosa TaxID=1961234 RepID=A0ABD3CUC8_9LAMI
MSTMMKTQISHLANKFGVPGKAFVVRKSFKPFTLNAKMVEIPGFKMGVSSNKIGISIAAGSVQKKKPKGEDGSVQEEKVDFGAFDLYALSFEWKRTNENDGDEKEEYNFTLLINWKVIVFLGLMCFVNKEVSFWIMKAIGIYFALQIAAVAYFNYSGNKN